MNKTLKVYQIINVNARIKNVIEGDSAINAAFKFKLLRLYSEIQGVVKDFEMTKDSLVNKYGKDVVDEKGEVVPNQKRISPEDENWKEFIKEMLKNGEMLSTDCEEKLEAAGFKKSTVKKARKKAGVISQKKGFQWYWSLPAGGIPKE